LRQALVSCGTDDKPLTFFIDEYKIRKDQWYSDLESILKNSMSSDITRKNDVVAVLTQLHSEIEDEKEGMKAGLSAADIARQNILNAAAQGAAGPSAEQAKEAAEDGQKMLQECPHVQGELYKIFSNRIRFNFHLVL
jgi:hypothetical protein